MKEKCNICNKRLRANDEVYTTQTNTAYREGDDLCLEVDNYSPLTNACKACGEKISEFISDLEVEMKGKV